MKAGWGVLLAAWVLLFLGFAFMAFVDEALPRPQATQFATAGPCPSGQFVLAPGLLTQQACYSLVDATIQTSGTRYEAGVALANKSVDVIIQGQTQQMAVDDRPLKAPLAATTQAKAELFDGHAPVLEVDGTKLLTSDGLKDYPFNVGMAVIAGMLAVMGLVPVGLVVWAAVSPDK